MNSGNIKRKTGFSAPSINTMIMCAVMIALTVILERIITPINMWNVKIDFGFVPVAVIAVMYGPIYGAVTWGMADFLGALILPIGPYFPGFTLSRLLAGFIIGVFIYNEGKISLDGGKLIIRTLLAAVTVNLAFTLVLDTVWISVLYGSGFVLLLPMRLIKFGIMIPAQTIIICAVYKLIARLPRNITGI